MTTPPGASRACERVCFIGGAPHSGSTLLGMILGAHPAVVYGGELRKSVFLGDASKPLKKRVCKLCGASCPVWGELSAPLEPDVYEVLARKTGRRIVVDSSKGTEWQREQLARLAGTTTEKHLVVLERDGRAIVASRLRKDPTLSPPAIIEEWMAQIARTDALALSFPGSVLRLHYEELATDPVTQTRRVTELLGVEFESSMLRFWEAEQHPLGGNDGTQFLVVRERSRRALRPEAPAATRGDVLDLVDQNLAYYGPHPAGIVLDVRWRHELTAEVLALFHRMAGEVNERFARPAL
ncbi:MAG: sulfotransferase [Sandaracinaceae bacterium]|nr:sulfotransferase [Sandaracinaceae bacterium]